MLTFGIFALAPFGKAIGLEPLRVEAAMSNARALLGGV